MYANVMNGSVKFPAGGDSRLPDVTHLQNSARAKIASDHSYACYAASFAVRFGGSFAAGFAANFSTTFASGFVAAGTFAAGA